MSAIEGLQQSGRKGSKPDVIPSHSHHWMLKPAEELGISKGECSCGASRYFADYMGKETLERVAKLNKEVSQSKPMEKKSKRGGSQWERRRYYETNKEAILSDLSTLGKSATLKKWGISYATWYLRGSDGKEKGLAVRWGVATESKSTSPNTPNVAELFIRYPRRAGASEIRPKLDVKSIQLSSGVVSLSASVELLSLSKTERVWLGRVLDLFDSSEVPDQAEKRDSP